MPLIKEENIDNSVIVGVWHCLESLSELEADYFLPLLDQEELNKTKIRKRKIEKFITRVLVKSLLEKHFSTEYQGLNKLSSGKPVLENYNFEVSISHCEQYIAAMISNKSKAGIDIQNINEKLKIVAPRIFSKEEILQIGGDDLLLARAWSAKEAMFKYYEKGKINFIRDLHLKNLSNPLNFFGILNCDEESQHVDFGVINLTKTYQIVYCYEK